MAGVHMNTWIYFVGTDDCKIIKIGKTAGKLSKRIEELERGQLSRVKLYLLAAVHANPSAEKLVQRHFAHLQADVNSTESFMAEPELVEYVNWLREQWWTALAIDDEDLSDTPALNEWMPTPDRRTSLQEDDPAALLQPYDAFGPLAGTPWARMSTPAPLGEDYYTPKYLVDAARLAMGGIDLDPASHWRANREHHIPIYYHLGRSAFDNPWFGRVWLNPPYGDNKPWFAQIAKYWPTGEMTQLCMISPVWVFTAKQAAPFMASASAMILLSPTPEFWGHPKGKTGTNHPHAIVYLGDRNREVREAFAPYGIPVRLDT
jgi:hypothetical protein